MIFGVEDRRTESALIIATVIEKIEIILFFRQKSKHKRYWIYDKTHHFSETKPITFPKQNSNQIIYFIRMAKQNKSIIAQWVKSDIYYI